jgi:hypothetical protein
LNIEGREVNARKPWLKEFVSHEKAQRAQRRIAWLLVRSAWLLMRALHFLPHIFYQ